MPADAQRLSLEEQEEIAMKVVAFFLSLICASFALLYIYFKMTESRRKRLNPGKKPQAL